MMKKRTIHVGGVSIGGDAAVSVQSMTNTDTRDVHATCEQIARLADAGAAIVRVAVPDREAADALAEIRRRSPVPLVADIHYDYRLALAAVRAGIDKIRINPGNIGSPERVRAVADACRERGVPIRIGVNSGSVERPLLEKYGGPTPEAMVESALGHAKLLEDVDFGDIAISMKASDVPSTIAAYRLADARCDYPLHLGVTHAGTLKMGTLKAAAGIGGLLAMGIGNTLRVSLTADPTEEVRAGYDILRAAGVLHDGVEFICCPTCGRCRIDVIGLAETLERRLAHIRVPLKVAVMGCAVNGPGEAREADIGVAGGDGCGLLFAKGEILHEKVPMDGLADALCALAERAAREKGTV
ncbi:MAG: flavodoxin-dependent (E)-4-hydroxy-3-methylbut-2-enyl-diphosphate synthase [Eubacteriales bacterium]